MFPSLVIISLLAFPPLDAWLQLQQFSPSLFCTLIQYQIARQNLVIHKLPQNRYISTTIHIFTDLVKARLSPPTRYSLKPQDYNLLSSLLDDRLQEPTPNSQSNRIVSLLRLNFDSSRIFNPHLRETWSSHASTELSSTTWKHGKKLVGAVSFQKRCKGWGSRRNKWRPRKLSSRVQMESWRSRMNRPELPSWEDGQPVKGVCIWLNVYWLVVDQPVGRKWEIDGEPWYHTPFKGAASQCTGELWSQVAVHLGEHRESQWQGNLTHLEPVASHLLWLCILFSIPPGPLHT